MLTWANVFLAHLVLLASLQSRAGMDSLANLDVLKDSDFSALKPRIEIGLDSGGEEIARIQSAKGTVSTLEGGRGVLFKAGTQLVLRDTESSQIELRPMLGFKTATTPQYANGRMSWNHVPLELVMSYHIKPKHLRFGMGLTYQIHNRMSGEGVLAQYSTSFRNATGILLNAEHEAFILANGTRMAVGGQITSIQYESTWNDASITGDSMGLTFAFY